MKSSILLLFIASTAAGQVASSGGATKVNADLQGAALPAPTTWEVTSRGPHENVWERTEYQASPSGPVPVVHKYIETATGLNYLSSGAWEPAKELIESFPGGAVARQGQHQVIFANDLATAGAIDMQMPDGKRMRSNILGLSYFDSASGKSVLIAQVKECQGVIVAPNQVLYPDAFTDFKGSIRYTYKLSGLEQDVIILERPQSPSSAFDMNPETTRLQVLTEFIEAPSPIKEAESWEVPSGQVEVDEELDFGSMKMVEGRAFELGNEDQTGGIRVSKQYLNLNGRNVLVEEIAYPAVAGLLDALPAAQASLTPAKAVRPTPSAERQLPVLQAARSGTNQMRLARAKLPQRGLVWDYVTVNATQTNYTFLADSTYYISSAVTLSGTNTFEGGAVLKYSTNGSLSAGNCLPFRASAYRPVVFTALDDNSVGETISGSTANPSGYYANPALSVSGIQSPLINHFRIAYARKAITLQSHSLRDIYHAQFINCLSGISGSQSYGYTVNDVLFANVITNFGSDLVGASIQNATFSGSGCIVHFSSAGSSAIYGFTNCIFANVSNLYNLTPGNQFNGDHNGFYNSPTLGQNQFTNTAYPFQTVGGGSYYLADSTFREVGTTNITATLLADLKSRTTYAPIAYTNVTFNNEMVFPPQARRDTNAPDLGYHYDPLDYSFGGCAASSNMTFTAGSAVGWFRTTSGWQHAGQAIRMIGDIVVSFEGTAGSPVYWVRLNTVQEQDRTAGYGHGSIENWEDPALPLVRGRFLRCSAMAGETFNGYFADDYGSIRSEMRDCEFWSGALGTYGDYMYYTNCLMQRASMGLWNGSSTSARVLRNCTFYGGVFTMQRNSSGPTPVSVRDCAFDGTAISANDYYGSNPTYTDYDYNAYTNATNPFPIGGAHDVVMTNGFVWLTSWLGDYYLPTNSLLINKGSTTANLVGLYHFTTQTNQVRETNSTVDIGYHYVAVDANGIPFDTYWDGTPDYLADPDGTLGDWLMLHFGHLGVNPNDNPDGDELSNLQEFLAGYDPNSPDSNGDGVIDHIFKVRITRPISEAVPLP